MLLGKNLAADSISAVDVRLYDHLPLNHYKFNAYLDALNLGVSKQAIELDNHRIELLS